MNAVVTGATKGIGRAIALQLAKMGYQLAICARHQEDLEEMKNLLRPYAVNVYCLKADCSEKAGLFAFIDLVKAHFEEVSVLVNNAGIYLPATLLDEPAEDFEYQQFLHVNATYYLSKEIGKMMRSAQKGHIFNICSVAAREIVLEAPSYTVTKTAMLSLNHVLRKELSAHHVKVTAILPGATLTASWENTPLPKEKFVLPEDIAKAIGFILKMGEGVNVDELVLTPVNMNV